MPTTDLTILHLSDLHFGGPGSHAWSDPDELGYPQRKGNDRPTLLGTLCQDLEALRKEDGRLWPQAVAITGDLLDRGKPEGIDPCLHFLTALAERLAIPRQLVFLCPGNHDMDLKSEAKDQSAAERALTRFIEICNRFYPPEVPRLSLPLPPERACQVFAGPADSLFVCLNSCEDVFSTEGQTQGYIGKGQLQHAEQLLAQIPPRQGLRIALLHHHLSQYEGAYGPDHSILREVNRLLRWLADNRFDMVLHGHNHRAGREIRVLPGPDGLDRPVNLLAAGSAGVAAEYRWKGTVPLFYQLLCLHDNGGVRMPRRFEPDPDCEKWQPHPHDRGLRLYLGSAPSAPPAPATKPDLPCSLSVPAGPVSPFHWRGRVDPLWFVGRQTEFDWALMRLQQGTSLCVVSERRGGRSSFLLALAERIRQQGLAPTTPPILDLQRGLLGGAPDFYRRLGQALGGNADSYEDVEWLLQSRHSSSAPLLLLDEFEVLANRHYFDPALPVWLRSLVNGGALQLVVASPAPLREIFKGDHMGSTLHGLLPPITLRPFGRPEVDWLCDRYLEGQAVRFSPAQREALRTWSAGHPCKLMIGCDHLFHALTSASSVASKPPADPAWQAPAEAEWAEVSA